MDPIMPKNSFHKLLGTLLRAISLRSHATRLSFSGTPARSLLFSPAIFFSYVLCPRLASGVLVVSVKIQRSSFFSGMDLYNEIQNSEARAVILYIDICQFFSKLHIAQNGRKNLSHWFLFSLETPKNDKFDGDFYPRFSLIQGCTAFHFDATTRDRIAYAIFSYEVSNIDFTIHSTCV